MGVFSFATKTTVSEWTPRSVERDSEYDITEKLNTFSKPWYQSKKFTYYTILFVTLFIVLGVMPYHYKYELFAQYVLNMKFNSKVETTCSFEIVESIPEGLSYPDNQVTHKSTFEAWKELIQMAKCTIEIGSFYWTMRKWNDFPAESQQGDEIFNDLLDAGLKRNIKIRIAQNKPSKNFPNNETEYLLQMNAAEVKSLNFDSLIGSGVLHTKFWIIDRKHVYIGSANMDWRSLTQVKELGIVMYNCSTLATDLGKIFDVYWMIGNTTKLPSAWPDLLETYFNSKNPMKINLGGFSHLVYLTSSPPQLSPKGRNDDLAAVLDLIKNAKKFIHISVMDYLPLIMYSENIKYWGKIDQELRAAVIDRNVEVRLLISKWPSTRPMEMNFLRSLMALNRFRKGAVLEVKLFKVPSTPSQSKIPFARVNHNKYMVTDNGGFIGTSNWSGDYFLSTAGVSLVSPSVNGSINIIEEELTDIFDRDWNSPYAEPLPPRDT